LDDKFLPTNLIPPNNKIISSIYFASKFMHNQSHPLIFSFYQTSFYSTWLPNGHLVMHILMTMKNNEKAKVSWEKAFEEGKFFGMEERKGSQREPGYATLPYYRTGWLQKVLCIIHDILYCSVITLSPLF